MSDDVLTMPRLGETMEQGTVRAWLVEAGKPFRRGDVIAEIETDKTTVEMPALADGTIVEFLAGEGDVVDVGNPIARLAASGVPEQAAAAPAPARPSAPQVARPAPTATTAAPLPNAADAGRVPASPAARRLAAHLGIDLAGLAGSGPNGRRQGADVRAFAEAGQARAGRSGTATLHIAEHGTGTLLPVVFLHGFGSNVDSWINVQNAIAMHRRTLALDLPGHGKSVAHPATNLAEMADAVVATLAAAGIARAHFVGHSMGAGVAAALALAGPARAATLTLLAPAGFGPLINRHLLAAFAAARREAEIAGVLPQFFGRAAHVPRALPALLASIRGDAAHGAALSRILGAMLDGDSQSILDVAGLAATGIPTRILWGSEDKVLPATTADMLPGVFALHRFHGVGHMPQSEVARETIRLIHESIRGE